MNDQIQPVLSLDGVVRNFGRGHTELHVLRGADFTIGAGFGTTPVVAVLAGSTDQRGQITITCDATAAQATATVLLTFADGAYAVAPIAMATVYSDNAITDSGSVRCVSSTTTMTMTLDVLPVDTKVYVFKWVCIA